MYRPDVCPSCRPTNSVKAFIHSFIHISLLILTMTERIMHNEKHALEALRNALNKFKNLLTGIQQTRMIKECQYTCFYNVRRTKLLSYSLMSFGMRLSITGSRP